MGKYRAIRNSFLGGQVSRTALGRTDLPQYSHSCEILQNMIPMLSGGAYRRPGTLNVDSLPITSDYAPRSIPFIVSRTEAYNILLSKVVGGAPYAKSYRATGNFTGDLVSNNVTGSVPPYVFQNVSGFESSGSADDEIQQVQFAQSADVMFLAHPNQPPQVISRTSKDTFVWDTWINPGGYHSNFFNDLGVISGLVPYINQNETACTLAVSSGTVGATGVTLTASLAIFTALNYGVSDITKIIGSIFRIDTGAGIGAILITGYTSSTVLTGTILDHFTSTSGYSTWWESAWSNIRGWPRSVCIFQERLVFGGTYFQPDTIWFSETGNYGVFSMLNTVLPTTSSIAQAILSGTTSGYNTISYIKYPDDSSPGDGQITGPTGSEPFRITLSQNSLDAIQWFSPAIELLIGTISQEWIISPASGDFSIANSPTVLQSKYGSDYVSAVRIGYELIFPLVQQDEVRAYQYNYIDASFFAEPVQLFFDEYPMAETTIRGAGTASFQTQGRRKFRSIDWDVTRQTLWCLDTAGNFFGMTRDRKLSVTMWHTHQFGGFNEAQGQQAIGTSTAQTTDPSYFTCDGSVVSFAVVPNPISGINDIWLVIKRSIDGIVNWQLERMIGKNTARQTSYQAMAPGISATEPLLVDAASVFLDNGDPTDLTYGSLDYLDAYSLTGTYYSPTNGIFKTSSGVVVSGSAVLNKPVAADYGTNSNILTLGLPYTPVIKPVRPDSGSVIGTAQGAIKRNNRAFVRFFKTLSAHIGSAPGSDDAEQGNALERIAFYLGDENLSQSPELYTGDKQVEIPSTYDRDGYIYMECQDPLPFTVISITTEGMEYD